MKPRASVTPLFALLLIGVGDEAEVVAAPTPAKLSPDATAFIAGHGGRMAGREEIPRDDIVNTEADAGGGPSQHRSGQEDRHDMPHQTPQANHGQGRTDG